MLQESSIKRGLRAPNQTTTQALHSEQYVTRLQESSIKRGLRDIIGINVMLSFSMF